MSDLNTRRLVEVLPLIVALTGVSGCTGFSSRIAGDVPRVGSAIPDTSFRISPALSIPLEKIVFWGVYAGAAYLILDPYAPNWDIEEAPLPKNQFHLALKMKRYYSGGAGEARSILHRRAKELAQHGGFDGYELLEYSESLESSVLGSQRAAQGVIRLTGTGIDLGSITPESRAGTGQGNAAPARMIPDSAKNPRS